MNDFITATVDLGKYVFGFLNFSGTKRDAGSNIGRPDYPCVSAGIRENAAQSSA